MPVTNLPSSQVNALILAQLATTSLEKTYLDSPLPSFMSNPAFETMKAAAEIGQVLNVEVDPVLPEPAILTTLDLNTESTISDFNTATSATIPVRFDYAISHKFKNYSTDNTYFNTLNYNRVQKMLNTAVKTSIRKMLRQVDTNLRTSANAISFGTSGTALNSDVFYNIRAKADDLGYTNQTIEFRLTTTAFREVTKLPEFQTKGAYVPASGNTAAANDTKTSNTFYVGADYDMRFIRVDTYDRPTPASDPIGSGYVNSSVLVTTAYPRMSEGLINTGAAIPITRADVPFTFSLKQVLKDVVVGYAELMAIEFYFGWTEFTTDVDSSGTLGEYPLFNLLGG